MTTPTMTPPGWYPDPSRRHDVRYWDGNQWSSQIADGGLEGTDSDLSLAASLGGDPSPGPAGVPTAGLPEPAPASHRRWVIPLVAVIAVLAVVAGLGIWRLASSGPSAADIYKQMKASVAAAKSVHITGAFTESGRKLTTALAPTPR